MCTAHREPRYSSITTIGTTFHIQHRSIQTKSTPHPTPQSKNSKLLRHNVPHPIPKHTDKSQHRTPHHNPRTQNSLGTTFHIQHRSIQTKSTPHPTPQSKNSKPLRHNVPHPIPKHTDKSQHRITHHNPRTLKKKPEGCAEGPWLYGPFAVFPQLPKAKKPGPLPRKQKQNQNPITQ